MRAMEVRFFRAFLWCFFIAVVVNGLPTLLLTSPFWDVATYHWPAYLLELFTDVGISGVGYWLIYLLFGGAAAVIRKIKQIKKTKSTDSGASDEASEAASEGKTWKERVLVDEGGSKQ